MTFSGALQERFELCTRKDRLGLLEGLDFLISGSLTDFEVLHDEVTAGVQLSFVVCKLLQLQHDSLLIFLCLDAVSLGLGLALRLVGNVLALLVNGVVGVLDKFLVGLLCIFLGADSLSFHCLCIV